MNKFEKLTHVDNAVPHPTATKHWQSREVNRGIPPRPKQTTELSMYIAASDYVKGWGVSVSAGRLETASDALYMAEFGLSPAELLEQLFYEQERKDERNNSASGIVEQSKTTGATLFLPTTLYMEGMVNALKKKGTFDEFRSLLAGAVFAHNAERFVKQDILKPGQVLLSGTRSHRLYQAIFPNTEEIVDPYQNSSLKGISESDGFITERDKEGRVVIKRVLEYKAGIKKSNLQDHYDTARKLKTVYAPHLFDDDTDFMFVVPKNTPIPQLHIYPEIPIFVHPLPFTRYELGKFMRKVGYDYRLTDSGFNKRSGNIRAEASATLEEVYEWAQEKRERGSAQLSSEPKVSIDEWLAARGYTEPLKSVE